MTLFADLVSFFHSQMQVYKQAVAAMDSAQTLAASVEMLTVALHMATRMMESILSCEQK
jgi:hypothetical protein